MGTEILRPIRGVRARITSLDECGCLEEDSSYVVTEGYIKVEFTPENEAGDEIIQKNADGALCINEKSQDSLKRVGVSIDWCEVNPDIINLITGFPVELDDTDVVGFRLKTGIFDTNWALEIWQRLAGAACGEEGACYAYWLLPYLTGASLTNMGPVQNGVTSFTTSGYTVVPACWDVGPYDVIGDPAGPLDVAIGDDELLLFRKTCVAPPDATDEATPVYPGSAPA